jgi:hypothetical protein
LGSSGNRVGLSFSLSLEGRGEGEGEHRGWWTRL